MKPPRLPVRPAVRLVDLARTDQLKPTTRPMILPPTSTPYVYPWPLRLLGGFFLALAAVGIAVAVVAAFLMLGFALVAFTVVVSRWVPPPITAVVVTALLLLAGWAWVQR